MTADEERVMREMKATISKLWREVAKWKDEAADWKDRYENALQAHEADLKYFNRIYSCTGPQQ